MIKECSIKIKNDQIIEIYSKYLMSNKKYCKELLFLINNVYLFDSLPETILTVKKNARLSRSL